MSEDEKRLLLDCLAVAARTQVKAEAVALLLLGADEQRKTEDFQTLCREIATLYADQAGAGPLAAVYRQMADAKT